MALVAVAAIGGSLYGIRALIASRTHAGDLLTGYLANSSLVDREFRQYYAKDAPSQTPRRQFEQAAVLVGRHNFLEAANLLEAAASQAPVPAVFNDLGVVYAQLNDRSRAGAAFRQALERDPGYGAVLANLTRLKRVVADLPVVFHESEPNNNLFSANAISVGVPMEGEIASDSVDLDFFHFRFPPAPRDVLAIEVASGDAKFAPRLDVYDSEERILDWGSKTAAKGQSLTVYGSGPPDSEMYVSVAGADGSSGRYRLTLKAMKAYDEYEPNDDVFHARRIQAFTAIRANIMDREDTDFYSFIAPHAGALTVELRNESVTLVPAIQLLGQDFRSKGFAPTVRNPGENVSANLDAEDGQLYYVQVWPQADSSGAYSLTVH